jgi:F0F1-type ATP synthase assembly protein I
MRAVIAGMAIGVALGYLMDNLAVGITLGVVFALGLRSVALWYRSRGDAGDHPG